MTAQGVCGDGRTAVRCGQAGGRVHARRRAWTTPSGSCRRAGLPGTAMPCSPPICRATAVPRGRRWTSVADMARWVGALLDAAGVQASRRSSATPWAAASPSKRPPACRSASHASRCSARRCHPGASRSAGRRHARRPSSAYQMMTAWAHGAARQDRRQSRARPVDDRRHAGAVRAQPAGRAACRSRCLQRLEDGPRVCQRKCAARRWS